MAQETERRSTKRSSKADIDVRTGGRLHPVEVMMKRNAVNETGLQGSDCRINAHLVMSILNAIQKNISVHKFHIRSKRQVLPCSITAEARVCSRTTTKEAQVTTAAAAKKNEECLDKDAEILRLIEERRSMSKEEKQRLKDLSKSFKKCIREKKD